MQSRFGTFVLLAMAFCIGTLMNMPSRAQSVTPTSDKVITFTARLTQTGTPITANMDLKFEIHPQDSGATSEIWSETIMGVAVRNGLLTVRLGEQTPLDGVFEGDKDLYVAIKTLSNVEIVTPRVKITAVPYALNAGSGGVPLGAIIAWFPPNPGADPPAGFEYCNGMAVVTTNSPYFNLRKPDLMGTPRVPRGLPMGDISTYGADVNFQFDYGGQDTTAPHEHTVSSHQHGQTDHRHSTPAVPPHTHHVEGDTGGPSHLANPGAGVDDFRAIVVDNLHTHHLSLDTDGPTSTGSGTSFTGSVDGGAGSTQSGGGGQTTTYTPTSGDNLPAYISVAYIIRVK